MELGCGRDEVWIWTKGRGTLPGRGIWRLMQSFTISNARTYLIRYWHHRPHLVRKNHLAKSHFLLPRYLTESPTTLPLLSSQLRHSTAGSPWGLLTRRDLRIPSPRRSRKKKEMLRTHSKITSAHEHHACKPATKPFLFARRVCTNLQKLICSSACLPEPELTGANTTSEEDIKMGGGS